MKIKELGGEFALIDRIKKDPKNANVKIGIGDDCAAVKINENTYHVYTTDMLVENDHFSLRYFSPYDIGWKAMISNVSDIASAGGKVLYALVAISLKSDATVELVDGIYEGIYAASERYGFDVIGGDTTHGELMTICITLVGEVSAADMKLRSGAKAGEILKLTAPIGGSTAGLRLFLKNIEGYEDVKRYHLHPECAMDLVPVIVPYATAMTDISDGLASEARNIAKASGLRADIFKNKIPLSEGCGKTALLVGDDVYDYALSGGEDFAILYSVPRQFSSIAPGFEVGYLSEGEGLYLDGEKFVKGGYDHFK